MGRIVEVQQPLISFRVFPSVHSRLFVYARVFESQKKMCKYVKDTPWYGKQPPFSYDALSRTWTRRMSDNGRIQKDMGEILFYKGRLQPDAITHECMHVTFEFMRRKKLPMPDRLEPQADLAEEIVCNAVGDMTDQIYVRLLQHDIKL